MSFAAIALASASLLILLGAYWAAASPLPEEIKPDAGEKIEDMFPSHTQHFPQLKQTLDSSDARYVSRRGSKDLERLWRAERSEILRSYVRGLCADFARVMRLWSILQAHSPNAVKAGESDWRRLALHFRFFYRMALLCIELRGACTLQQLARLSAYVGSLSALASSAMARAGYAAVEAELKNDTIA